MELGRSLENFEKLSEKLSGLDGGRALRCPAPGPVKGLGGSECNVAGSDAVSPNPVWKLSFIALYCIQNSPVDQSDQPGWSSFSTLQSSLFNPP
jgi:hypothetical protein